MEWRCGWILIGIGMLTLGCQAGGRTSVLADRSVNPISTAANARDPVASRSQARSQTQSPAIKSLIVQSDGIRSAPEKSDVRLISGTASESPAIASDPTTPSTASGAITLAAAVALALEQNPDLVAQRQADSVSSAALGVAQTYPFNPSVQVQATPIQDAKVGGPGTTYHYVLLMQTIQLAHQQQFREDGAAAVLNSTRWNIHQAELLTIAQTERLYFNSLYQRGLRDLATASDANNQQLLDTLEKQLAAGQATAADAAIVRIDARSTRQQARLAHANYLTALRDLRRHLNLPPQATEEPAENLPELHWQPATTETVTSTWGMDDPAAAGSDVKEVIAGLAGTRPDVMAARSDIDTARAGLGLASASRTPDLQVGPYYQRGADGTTFLGLRAQMDLPVVNSGRPLETQRNCELHQRVMIWQQLQTRAELEAQAALERYELAYQMVAEERTTQHASLPSELQRLEAQFKAGEVDVIRVIQARTSMIQNQRVYLDLLNELAQATANLTAATGIASETLLVTPPGK